MARTPKPTRLKLLSGERADRIPTAEVVPSELPVEPPAGMSDHALDVWARHAPDLVAKKVLTSWDVQAFRTWCDAIATCEAAADAIDRDGAVVDAPVFDRNGKPTGTRAVKSPWWGVWKDAADIAARYGAKFGLTPSDRARLPVVDLHKPNGDPSRLLS